MAKPKKEKNPYSKKKLEIIYSDSILFYDALFDENCDDIPEIEKINDVHELCSGIFWVISDSQDLSNHKLLMFDIPCDPNGTPNNTHTITLNAKSGNTYNHKKLWDTEIKNNSKHRPYNRMEYDYYPRGRVQISHNRADIYLNPNINEPKFIDEIKEKFGLQNNDILKVRTIIDGSEHYKCFLDRN
jgi:hypothetical protein